MPTLKHDKTSHYLLLRPHAEQGGGGDVNLGQVSEEIPLNQVLEVDRVGETQVKGLFLQE